MELEIERHKRGRKSIRNRRYETLGHVPDQSGEYTLPDGSAILVDASDINPEGNWKLGLKVTPAPGQERKYSPGSAKDLTKGITIYLNNVGDGGIKLSQTKRLTVELDRSIAEYNRQTTGLPQLEEYYPDYPGAVITKKQLNSHYERKWSWGKNGSWGRRD